jgi:predicted transposase YdaD
VTSSIETSDAWPVVNTPFAKATFSRGKREGKKEGRREGRREGYAKAILVVLEARGLDVNNAERAWIATCTNRKQLKIWLRYALTAGQTSDLFD